MPKVSIGRRDDGSSIEVILSKRSKRLWIPPGQALAIADLSTVQGAAPALETIGVNCSRLATSLEPLAGHPTITRLFLQCTESEELDLSPLATIPRLQELTLKGKKLKKADLEPLAGH